MGSERRKLCRRFEMLQPCTLRTHNTVLWVCLCVCVESLSVMSSMRNVALRFFTHAAGSSISGNISHSASLTPSALLQYPHIFPSFPFSSIPPLQTLSISTSNFLSLCHPTHPNLSPFPFSLSLSTHCSY